MGIYLPFLAALLTMLIGSSAIAGGGQSCLTCHKLHYTDRGTCTDCHRGNPFSERKNIAHSRLIGGSYAYFTLGDSQVLKEGKRLMELLACRRCHQSAGTGNRLAASLDNLLESRQPSAIADSILHPVTGMPDFRLSEKQAAALVNAVLSGSRGKKSTKERPLVMHFDGNANCAEDVFSLKCGACHRVLTARQGLLGKGNIGPNLSGLLTSYYPHNYRHNEVWSFSALQSWLQNPRQVRPDSIMMPVTLDSRQLQELKRIFEAK